MLRTGLLRKVKAHVAGGGIIAYATESCFGFGCDPFNYLAVRRLLRLKRRPQRKGLIVIGANLPQLQRLMPDLSDELRDRALAQWPNAPARESIAPTRGPNAPARESIAPTRGPNAPARESIAPTRGPGEHTWLVPARTHLPAWLRGRHERFAVRITAHAGARALCSQLNLPLVSTSANRSSRVSIKSYRECLRQFGVSTLVLPGRIGRSKRPSTIADLLTGAVIRG
jgi:L-threonylcarbamoyladenylate synthase